MSAVYRNAAPPAIPWFKEGFFDFWSTRVNSLWTLRRPLVRLVGRTSASADAVTLQLQPNRHVGGLLPGQHVNLGVELDGRVTTRSYSPTVLDNGHLAITVKAIPGGKVSQHLARTAAIGDVFSVGPGFGDMTVALSPQRLVLLAGGSGITPMRSLLRQLDKQPLQAPVDLVYWVRRQEELCFIDELQAMAARQPGFKLHTALTRDAATPAPRVDSFDFSGFDQLAGARVLACGPAGFVDAAKARLGAHVASFEGEAFSMPVLPELEQGSVQVELLRSGRSLSIARGTSLLTALEAAGIQPASGCRMGLCNTCVCTKVSGITRHTLTGDHASEPSIPLKLCVNSASTDLTLEL